MNEKLLLRDMLNYLYELRNFAGEGRAALVASTKTQYAVIYAYQVVGEIAKRLPDDFRSAHPEISWRKLINFRDFLAHNYEKIALGPVWAAIESLPELIAQLEALVDSLGEDSKQ